MSAPNTRALLSILGDSALDIIFQALATERDRLKEAYAKDPSRADQQHVDMAETLTEMYANARVADKCCGNAALRTHAYCEEAPR